MANYWDTYCVIKNTAFKDAKLKMKYSNIKVKIKFFYPITQLL